MADLPIPSAAPASPAAVARPGANVPTRGAAARERTTPLEDNSFQAAMALELGQLAEGQALPGLAVPAAAADTDSSTDEAAAQVAIPDLTPLGLALPVIPPLPPAPALSAQSAAAGMSPLSTGFALAGMARTAMAPAAQQNARAVHQDLLAVQQNTVAAQQNPLAAREDLQSQASAAAKTELPLSTTPDAADAGLPGKPMLPAIGEFGRETALVSGLPQEHKTAPAHAIHAGSTGLVQTAPVQAAPAPVAALEARVGARGWDQGLGDKLVWMASHKQQVAELHLNPPDLGPLKITLTLNQDQASAQFVSTHAAVREAIETAMPRLREMLAENGITLGNANVSTDAFREQAQPQQEPRSYPAAPAAADPGAVTRGERLRSRARGLVDTFA